MERKIATVLHSPAFDDADGDAHQRFRGRAPEQNLPAAGTLDGFGRTPHLDPGRRDQRIASA